MNLTQEQWQTILAALTVVSAVFYAARRFGSLETLLSGLATSVDTQSAELKKNSETTSDVRLAVAEIKTDLFGASMSNGLRSEVRELKTEIKQVKHDLRNVRQVLNMPQNEADQ